VHTRFLFSSGAASIGKGIGGILFSRFSRSSGQVGGVEEEPSDSEGGACEKMEDGLPVELDDTFEENTEEKIEEKTGDTRMSHSASVIMDNSSCKHHLYKEVIVQFDHFLNTHNFMISVFWFRKPV